MEHMPWIEALRSAGHAETARQLTARIGEDVIHALPWGRIRRVLDIGAGLGALTHSMARRGATVVALEQASVRARFIHGRATQDGLDVHAVVASALEPPFESETFDLVTISGDVSDFGAADEGSPRQRLVELLGRVRRLLRPGGYVYLSNETRLGLSAIMGRRDRSGLRFTSLLPRSLADRYCRMRGRSGYRRWTYTPGQYREIFEESGFANVLVQGIVGQPKAQRALFDVGDRAMRNVMRGCTERPVSLAGRLKRSIAHSRLLATTVEDHVAIVAGRDVCTSPILWQGVAGSRPAGQINTYSKVMALSWEDGAVHSVVETAKNAIVARRLDIAYDVLQRAETACGKENARAQLRWVRPLGAFQRDGRQHYRYEFVAGKTLTALALSRRGRKELPALFESTLFAYPELCRRLAAGRQPNRTRVPHAGMLETLAATWWDPALVSRAEEALAVAEHKGWEAAPIQGDLSGDNVVVGSDGRLCLIDWETVDPLGYPVLDLIRLYYDLAMEMLDGGVRSADATIDELRARLWRVLCGLGHVEQDLAVLETLYFAHQAQALGEKARSVGVTGMRLDRLQGLIDDERYSIRFCM